MSVATDDDKIMFRPPTVDDGAGMWKVVDAAGVLDPNSSYLYLLLARDFADVCVVAEHEGEIVGFVTGYRPPTRPDSIFLWQVGMRPDMQGRGLGKRLVAAFLNTAGSRGATLLETTVTPSNEASRALFHAIARDLGTECRVTPCFSSAQFPQPGHEDEELFEIGPYDPSRLNRLTY